MSAQVARLFFTVDRLSDGCDRVFLLYNAASSPNPTSSRTLLSPHPVTPPPPLCRLLPNHCLHRLLPTWPRPLASAASSPTCAITSSPLPARVMCSGSHDALRSGHNGPRSGHHDSDPWSPGHVRSARHRAASTWATEVEENLLEVRCTGWGETLPIPPASAPTSLPSAARLPCGSMLAVPLVSGVAAAGLWRRAHRLCPSAPLKVRGFSILPWCVSFDLPARVRRRSVA
jgi:hypothetical protein